MTRLYRAAVYLVTFAIPVVIAACYGVGYRYRKGGTVLDKQTRGSISEIDVSCDFDGGTSPTFRTGDDGVFQIQSDQNCINLRAVDTLGPPVDGGAVDAGSTNADGGTGPRTARYATKTVPNDTASDQTLELDRSN